MTYQLEVYYSQVDESNQDKMVVNGTNESFLQNLEEKLNIIPDNLPSFKNFLQTVENMNLKISNLITYISRSEPGK